MNAIPEVIEPSLPAEPFKRASAEVNQWRGRCLQIFAGVEHLVTECLLLLAEVPDKGKDVRLRHLVGQRFEDLSLALAVDGPFATEGEKILKALTAFRDMDDLRAMLCHAAAEVTLNEQGDWTAIFRHVAIRSKKRCAEQRVIGQSQAEMVQRELRSNADRLRSYLNALITSLQATTK
jgi:hypothetical protein